MEKVVVFGGPIYECLTQFDRGEPGSFNVIIDQLKDPEADFRQLDRLILEIKKCAPLLTKHHVKLLRTLLGMGWGDFPDQVLSSWLTTVQAVVTSQPVHLRTALSSLVNVFRVMPKDTEPGLEQDDIDDIRDKQAKQCRTVHLIIDQLLSKIPLAEQVLVDILAEKLPNRHGPPRANQVYLENLISITERHASLRKQLMKVIMKHLCDLDHVLPKSFLESHQVAESGNDDDSEDEMRMETDVQKIELLKVLDSLCCQFIDFIDRTTLSEDKAITDCRLRVMLREFMPTFEKVLLPQPTTKAVQFILFYLLSLKVSFPDSFIDWLLKRVTTPSEPMLQRRAAASYLCGLCARADYVPQSTMAEVVRILARFCVEYLANIPVSKRRADQSKFLPFYFVAQTLFYIIIFRREQLGITLLSELNLRTIVFAKLNPLAEMVPGVAQMFADIMKETEVLFCHQVIDQARRERLAIRGHNDTVNPIDFHFPFDQCRLPKLNERVDSFYNYWNDNDEDESSSGSEGDEMEK